MSAHSSFDSWRPGSGTIYINNQVQKKKSSQSDECINMVLGTIRARADGWWGEQILFNELVSEYQSSVVSTVGHLRRVLTEPLILWPRRRHAILWGATIPPA